MKARQKAGQHMPCPSCGMDTMKEPIHTNALSRATDLYVCDAYDSAEAMLALMKQEYPLTFWAAFQPVRPPSDLEARPAAEVLQRVLKSRTHTDRSVPICAGMIRRTVASTAARHLKVAPALRSCGRSRFRPSTTQRMARLFSGSGRDADGRVQIAESVIDK